MSIPKKPSAWEIVYSIACGSDQEGVRSDPTEWKFSEVGRER
jgi:hypothetical protein